MVLVEKWKKWWFETFETCKLCKLLENIVTWWFSHASTWKLGVFAATSMGLYGAGQLSADGEAFRRPSTHSFNVLIGPILNTRPCTSISCCTCDFHDHWEASLFGIHALEACSS